MRTLKRTLLILVAGTLAVISISGCWDREEIDHIGIVGAMGLDKGEGDSVVVSLEVMDPSSMASSLQSGSQASIASLVLRDQADTISAAIANAQRRVPRTLTTGQLGTIICGQDLARQGIGAYLDFLLRDAKIRNSAILATCDTGSGLLQRHLLDPIPSATLLGLSRNAPSAGKTVTVTINEFVVKLTEPGIEPVTMHTAGRRTKDVQVKRQGQELKQTEKAVVLDQPVDVDVDIPGELPDDSPVLDPLKESGSGEFLTDMTIDVGIAAYKHDKLVGLLDGKEARGFLWLAGRLQRTAVDVPDPFGSGRMVELDVVRADSSIKPVLSGGKEGMKMKAEVHVDLEAAQFEIGSDLRQEGIVEALEQSVNALVTQEITTTLDRVQTEFKSDIYGFGFEVYKSNPHLWATMEATWNEEVFPFIEVELDVNTRIRAPGAIYGIREHGPFK